MTATQIATPIEIQSASCGYLSPKPYRKHEPELTPPRIDYWLDTSSTSSKQPELEWPKSLYGFLLESLLPAYNRFQTPTTTTPKWEITVVVNPESSSKLTKQPAPHLLSVYWRRIEEMQTILHSFTLLPENWDYSGGSPIAPIVTDEAKQILMVAIDLGISKAWLAPGSDGSIGIQWETNTADLLIIVDRLGSITYVLTTLEECYDGELTKHNLYRVLAQFAEEAT